MVCPRRALARRVEWAGADHSPLHRLAPLGRHSRPVPSTPAVHRPARPCHEHQLGPAALPPCQPLLSLCVRAACPRHEYPPAPPSHLDQRVHRRRRPRVFHDHVPAVPWSRVSSKRHTQPWPPRHGLMTRVVADDALGGADCGAAPDLNIRPRYEGRASSSPPLLGIFSALKQLITLSSAKQSSAKEAEDCERMAQDTPATHRLPVARPHSPPYRSL